MEDAPKMCHVVSYFPWARTNLHRDASGTHIVLNASMKVVVEFFSGLESQIEALKKNREGLILMPRLR